MFLQGLSIGAIGEVAACFDVPRNTVAQVKTRVNRMIAAIEGEYGE